MWSSAESFLPKIERDHLLDQLAGFAEIGLRPEDPRADDRGDDVGTFSDVDRAHRVQAQGDAVAHQVGLKGADDGSDIGGDGLPFSIKARVGMIPGLQPADHPGLDRALLPSLGQAAKPAVRVLEDPLAAAAAAERAVTVRKQRGVAVLVELLLPAERAPDPVVDGVLVDVVDGLDALGNIEEEPILKLGMLDEQSRLDSAARRPASASASCPKSSWGGLPLMRPFTTSWSIPPLCVLLSCYGRRAQDLTQASRYITSSWGDDAPGSVVNPEAAGRRKLRPSNRPPLMPSHRRNPVDELEQLHLDDAMEGAPKLRPVESHAGAAVALSVFPGGFLVDDADDQRPPIPLEPARRGAGEPGPDLAVDRPPPAEAEQRFYAQLEETMVAA